MFSFLVALLSLCHASAFVGRLHLYHHPSSYILQASVAETEEQQAATKPSLKADPATAYNSTATALMTEDQTTDGNIPTAMGDDQVDLLDNKEIAHLQKKLRYWKKQQSKKEADYKMYVHRQMVDNKMKPIYVREGKIDTYKMRPVFDQTTEQIQTEIWTIKEKIKLTYAKLEEEMRVERVKRETEQKMQKMVEEANSNFKTLESQFTSSIEKVKEESAKHVELERQRQIEIKQEAENKLHALQTQFTNTVELSEKQQQELEAKIEQEKQKQIEIMQEAENKIQSLQSEYTKTLDGVHRRSERRLSEKEQEIDGLAQEIEAINDLLQKKSAELNAKQSALAELEDELEKKEATLKTLWSERASLRALVRQSWKVMSGRVKARFNKGHEEEKRDGDVVEEAIAVANVSEAIPKQGDPKEEKPKEDDLKVVGSLSKYEAWCSN